MSQASIRKALENKLRAVAPTIHTAWQDKKFKPQGGRPYQKVDLLFADTDNPAMGNGMHRETGIFQITLAYPTGEGPGDIEARGELLRTTFFRGLTLTQDGIDVIIEKTPSMLPRPTEKDRVVRVIKIEFFADVFN